MFKKLIFVIAFLIIHFIGCSNSKVKTDMMDTINSERNELIVLENAYRKYSDAVDYFVGVRNSDASTPLKQEDCFTYYGIAKSNLSSVANSMDTTTYISLINLRDSTNYLVAIADIWLMTCDDNNMNQEQIDLAVTLHAKLLKNAIESRDTFSRNAQELLSKYNYDLQVYGTYTTQETQQKKQFWAQFFGAIAGSLASSIGNNQSTGSSTYTITDTGNGTFNITNTQTGEMKFCNSFGNFANCF